MAAQKTTAARKSSASKVAAAKTTPADETAAAKVVKRAPRKTAKTAATAGEPAAAKKAAKSAPASQTAASPTTRKRTTKKASAAADRPAGGPTAATPARAAKATKTTRAAGSSTSAAKSAPASASAKAGDTPPPAAKVAARRGAGSLAVREGERPWTAKEVAEVREMLASDEARLNAEISSAEEEIGQLLREGGEGAGHDQADVGSNTFERDHEMSMARNARDNLRLVHDAITRIDEGTYGICESCGQAIGKMRLQAFPRATLCMECKQKQERR